MRVSYNLSYTLVSYFTYINIQISILLRKNYYFALLIYVRWKSLWENVRPYLTHYCLLDLQLFICLKEKHANYKCCVEHIFAERI